MSSTTRERMDWKRIFTELLSEQDELEVEALSAALIARGQHELARGGDMLKDDEKLRRLNSRQMLEAALYPGPTSLRGRLEEAVEALARSGHQAHVAERAIVAVLDTRDQWVLKSLALSTVGIVDVARDVTGQVGDFDAFLLSCPFALESVSGFKDEALAVTVLDRQSIWHHVPDAIDVEPSFDEEGKQFGLLTDEELTLVAFGEADEVLDQRVASAIKTDKRLRERYDWILAELDAIESVDAGPLPVVTLLRNGAHAARPVPQKLAASDGNAPRYAEPAAEDEIFVFADNSQLFAQKRPNGWVLFLYRRSPREDDTITGAAVEATWTEGRRLLCAEVRSGEVQVRCNGEVQAFKLDVPPE